MRGAPHSGRGWSGAGSTGHRAHPRQPYRVDGVALPYWPGCDCYGCFRVREELVWVAGRSRVTAFDVLTALRSAGWAP